MGDVVICDELVIGVGNLEKVLIDVARLISHASPVEVGSGSLLARYDVALLVRQEIFPRFLYQTEFLEGTPCHEPSQRNTVAVYFLALAWQLQHHLVLRSARRRDLFLGRIVPMQPFQTFCSSRLSFPAEPLVSD